MDRNQEKAQPGQAAGQAGGLHPGNMLEQSRVDFTRAAKLTPEVIEQIQDAFDYHPLSERQQEAGAIVRSALASAVMAIVEHVPPGPDRSAAIRKCREARMDANSAITHGGRY